MKYPDDMEPECIALCDAINLFEPDIFTIGSCCGHGRVCPYTDKPEPYRIFFLVENLERLPELLYWFDGCHCGFYGWRVFVRTDCAMSHSTFCLEGPAGEQGYAESEKIAEYIREYIETGET